tara:strand:+ start:653 stop:895 length:243 start_codon:yes stop_codon:yes gene_type:complete
MKPIKDFKHSTFATVIAIACAEAIIIQTLSVDMLPFLVVNSLVIVAIAKKASMKNLNTIIINPRQLSVTPGSELAMTTSK